MGNSKGGCKFALLYGWEGCSFLYLKGRDLALDGKRCKNGSKIGLKCQELLHSPTGIWNIYSCDFSFEFGFPHRSRLAEERKRLFIRQHDLEGVEAVQG